MKLKLNTTQTAAAAAANSPASQTPTPATGIKLNFNKSLGSAGSPPAVASLAAASPILKIKTSKAGALSASKKRVRENDDDESKNVGPVNKKLAIPVTLSLSQKPTVGSPSVIKLKAHDANKPVAKSSGATTTSAQPRLKIKARGRLPPRPAGVGYDSDAEDAELDPAMEENIILRMAPGPDCDYLRNAIDERKVGLPVSQGGADVSMRFFTRDGRRAVVNVRGRHYAAVLVDLPCIIESMKSWDKRGWWKSADICQMLVVLGVVETEEAAKTFPGPKEVNEQSWQWPHGLTPPMHNVRKRRFRKRVSHRTIEAAEEEVERLLAADEQAKAQHGESQWEILDLEALRREELGGDDYEDEDAEGDVDDGYFVDEDDETAAETIAMMEKALGADDDDEVIPASIETDAIAVKPTPTIEGETLLAIGSGPDVPELREQHESEVDEEDEDEEDEDEDEEDDEEEVEVDEEAREQAQQLAQQREEIAYLEQQLAMQKEAYNKQQNPLLRQKLVGKIKSYEADLQVKRRALGVTDDDV